MKRRDDVKRGAIESPDFAPYPAAGIAEAEAFLLASSAVDLARQAVALADTGATTGEVVNLLAVAGPMAVASSLRGWGFLEWAVPAA